MTLQEIFDKSSAHLLTQNKRSETGRGFDRQCVYRGANGRMCAVGVLITNAAYSPSLEGRGCGTEKVMHALEASGVPTTEEALGLMTELQYIHDYCEEYEWYDQLRDLAYHAGLAFNPPQGS